MLLGIRTDSPIAELYLYSRDGNRLSEKTWEAGRTLARTLLEEIDLFLRESKLSLDDLTGLFAFTGPGSFTGLRIGLTVMNSLAYARSLPVVGTAGDDWIHEGLELLQAGRNEVTVLPFYGAEARITAPKKL